QVVHVALGLGELHLVHALARVPVEEGFAAEHGRELLRDPLEELLDGRAVADEAPVPGVTGCHHVLGIKDLLGELGHGEGPVLLAPSGGQGREAWHEEVEPWEGHHVNGQLPEVGVELPGEAQASGDPAHGGRNEVVEVP
ncbi:hypothetical protein N333_08862, partial [Nestor notabilis]